MRALKLITAATTIAVLAFVGFAAATYSQEVQPETLLVRVSNPASLYGNLFVVCGSEARPLGLVGPNRTTTLKPEVVDLACGGEQAKFGIVFENRAFVVWDLQLVRLDDPELAGVLVCVDEHTSALLRIPKPNEVPPLCPKLPSQSSLPSFSDVLPHRQA